MPPARGRSNWPSWLAAAVTVLAVLLCVQTAQAAPPPTDESRYRLELLTVGPGDAFFTRAGHAALVVVEVWPDGREMTTVYNYGDADFTDPWLSFRFVFGQPQFRLAVSGDLFETVEFYGPRQNRDVYRQRLALSTTQAKQVADTLAEQVLPGNAEYPYHYLQRTCTTELRTLLDTLLDGALQEQLADPDPWTVREYQQLTFDGDAAVAMVSDAIFGRRHDAPIDRYFALMWPDRMRAYLQEVRVADPEGGASLVPLASEPELVAQRGGAPATETPNRATTWFAPIAASLVLVGAAVLRARAAVPSRLAGVWLLAWSLPVGLLGLVIVVLSAASTVPEFGDNELVLSLLVTDLAVVPTGVRWLGGRVETPGWLPRYAMARTVVVGLAVLLHGVGVFVQQPWVIPPASLACGVALWWLVQRRTGVSS